MSQKYRSLPPVHSLETLNKESLKRLWSKTYNTERKPDWSHIFPYYHDNIVFQDSIQHLEGIDDFKAICNHLTDCCSQLN